MELNVGDYVRTKDGHIDKIVKISDEMKSGRTIKVQIGEIDNIGGYKDFVDWFSPSHFIKSKPKITDLVEVGDYVNGSKVIKIEEYNDEKYIYVEEMEFCNACNEYENVYYKEDTIKSIVTKEQFETMQYVVGEK